MEKKNQKFKKIMKRLDDLFRVAFEWKRKTNKRDELLLFLKNEKKKAEFNP